MKKSIIVSLLAGALGFMNATGVRAGVVRISDWLIAGPFVNEQTQDLLNFPFIDEPAACPASGEPAGDARWQKFSGPFLDFTKQGFTVTRKCAAYAFTYLHAETDRLAVLRFGSDDGAVIWLNGIRVLEQFVKRSLMENQDTVFVQLQKGWNRLLVKVDQGGGGWETVCTLVADGVRICSDRPDMSNLVKPSGIAITKIGIGQTDRSKATLSCSVHNYGVAGLSRLDCRLTGADGHTEAVAVVKPVPAGTRLTVEITLPLTRLCALLASEGAHVSLKGKGLSAEVPIGSDASTDLLLKAAALPGFLTPEAQKAAGEIVSCIWIYGLTGDISELSRKGLQMIASNRPGEAQPVLQEIRQVLVAAIPDLKNDTIVVTGHAHMDMNWLWPYNESVKMFQDNFRQTIAFMERFPDYRMLQSQATIYKHIEEMDPPLFEKVKKYVATGRLELAGGMWTEGDCNLTGGEAICRSFLLGQRYFLDKFGKTARVGWLPDNFGHVSQYPQLLRLAGCDYYYFHRCVPFIGPFRWIGPDGSSVFCFTNYTYNGEITPALKNEPARISPLTRKILHPTGIGDHGGGPTLKNIEMIHRMDATPGFPSIRFGSAESFFETTEKMPVEFPVHRGEMQFIFEGCYTSVAEIKENTRKSEQSMYAAEFLSSLRWLAGDPYPARDFRDLWETVTFNQFHDILPGSAIYETYQDAVADHKMVQKKALSVFESGFRRFSDEIACKTGIGQPVVALNLQPRSGKVLVEADVYSHSKPVTALLSDWGDYYEYGHVKPATGHTVATMMVRDETGRNYPAQIIGGRQFPPGYRTKVEFVVDSMPAGGYKTFYVDPTVPGCSVEAISEQDGVVETDHFVVRVDMNTGDITGLKDKQAGKDYVPAGGRLNRLQVWMEAPNGMNAWTIGAITDTIDITDVERVTVTERGPVRLTIEAVKKWGRSKFIQRTHIYKSYPRIDFELDAHWFETGDGKNPAPFLKVGFDISLDNPAFDCQVPFDVVRRPVSGQEVPAQQWVDVTDGKNGIALLNRTKFGHSFSNGRLNLSLLRASYSPDLYPNLGINHIQYSLFPHEGDWKNGVWAEGENFNIPVYAAEPPSLALVKSHATRPESGSLIAVSPAEVVMSGIKQAENGNSLIIRLAEVKGEGTEVRIALPAAVREVSRVNIIELPLEGAEKPVAEGNTIRFKIKPHEVVTLAVGLK